MFSGVRFDILPHVYIAISGVVFIVNVTVGRADTVGVGARRNRFQHILKMLTEVITVVVGGGCGGGGGG